MDLMASGTNPGTTYTISPTSDPGVYHEDRLVVTEVAPSIYISQMFRVYGATFTPNVGWDYMGASTAYATVQDPDGSIHYFTYNGTTTPWQTEDWQGSGNNTIYNIQDFVPASSGGNNNALIAFFSALSSASQPGGFVRIPQANFPVVSTASGLVVTDQTIIQGLGTGGATTGTFGPYYHFTITDGETTASALFSTSGGHTSGGVEFRNLAFNWPSAEYQHDTVINANVQGTLVYRCTFTDCPTAVNMGGAPEGGNALSATLTECAISYTQSSDQAAATAVVMAGQQLCVQGPAEFINTGGPAGCISIGIGGSVTGNEHNVIRGVHLTDWTICVDYADTNGAVGSGGCEYTTIADCEMAAIGSSSTPYTGTGSCINLAPPSSSGKIYGQKIFGNTMHKSHNSTTSNAVVRIDTTGGVNTNVQSIDLIGNLIFSAVDSGGTAQANTYGVQINAGDSIRILGGKIGNFGTGESNDGTANICISGNPGEVIIEGVDLRPTFANVNAGGATASEYALLIAGALTSGPIQVRGCDMTGFGGGPVGVTGSVTIIGVPVPGRGPLYVTNCTGYNDQNTVINTLTHLTTGTPYAAYNQGGNSGTSYYGPSFVMFTASTSGGTFQVNGGTAQTLLAGQVVSVLGGHSKAASRGHLKTGQSRWAL